MDQGTIKRIEDCKFECQAGPLTNNQDWIDLKRFVSRSRKNPTVLTPGRVSKGGQNTGPTTQRPLPPQGQIKE